MTVEDLVAEAEALDPKEFVRLHRAIASRAARIYEPLYRAKREENFAIAMQARDTRFRRGLSPVENWTRNWESPSPG